MRMTRSRILQHGQRATPETETPAWHRLESILSICLVDLVQLPRQPPSSPQAARQSGQMALHTGYQCRPNDAHMPVVYIQLPSSAQFCLAHRTGPLWPAIRASRVATQRTFQAAPKTHLTYCRAHTTPQMNNKDTRASPIASSGSPTAADPTPCRNPHAGPRRRRGERDATNSGRIPHHHSPIGICGLTAPPA